MAGSGTCTDIGVAPTADGLAPSEPAPALSMVRISALRQLLYGRPAGDLAQQPAQLLGRVNTHPWCYVHLPAPSPAAAGHSHMYRQEWSWREQVSHDQEPSSTSPLNARLNHGQRPVQPSSSAAPGVLAFIRDGDAR
jgi:hypothetical protein